MQESKPGTIFHRNPILFYALVQSLLGLFLAFGIQLSAEQIAAILSVTNVILALISNSMVMPLPIAQQKIEEALMTPPPIRQEEQSDHGPSRT